MVSCLVKSSKIHQSRASVAPQKVSFFFTPKFDFRKFTQITGKNSDQTYMPSGKLIELKFFFA